MTSSCVWLFDSDGKQFQVDDKDLKVLGRGSFGKVFQSYVKTKNNGIGEICAMKHMDLSREYLLLADCVDEVNIMKSCLNNPNLVQFIGSAHNEETKTYAIAMELAFCPLDGFITSNARSIEGLPYEIFIDVIRDCTSALRCLKEINVAHRDIKSENILVFHGSSRGRRSKFLFKMSDFGCSRQKQTYESIMNTIRGTPNHLHPIIARNYLNHGRESYTTEQCDIWSLACTFHFCAENKHAFDTKNPNLYYKWVNDIVTRPDLENAIGVAAKLNEQNGYKYVHKLVNENYPKWFIHCATRLLVSMFHKQNFEELEKTSQAIVEVEESTFLILDPPNRLEIIKYADLSRMDVLKDNYPNLKKQLGIEELREDYFVISNLGIEEFTRNYVPQPGKTYIVMRHYGSHYERIPKWRFPDPSVPEWRFPDPDSLLVNKKESYTLRCNYIKKAYDALTGGDNLYKLFTGMMETLTAFLEKLETSHGCGSLIERMEFDQQLAKYLQTFANFTAVVASEHVNNEHMQIFPQLERHIGYNKSKLNRIMNETEKLKAAIKTYHIDYEEFVGIEDKLSDLLVDPEKKEEIYESGVEYCQTLLKKCLERKKEITKQLHGLFNNGIDIHWIALEARDLYNEMQGLQSDILKARKTFELPLQHFATAQNQAIANLQLRNREPRGDETATEVLRRVYGGLQALNLLCASPLTGPI